MNRKPIVRRMTRRRFLRGVGHGALLTPLLGSRLARAVDDNPQCPTGSDCRLRLVATDGHFALPGRTQVDAANDGNAHVGPLYGFGFSKGGVGQTISQLGADHKGLVRWPAPIIGVDEADRMFVTMTNVGFQYRPDLDDAHTIHWHGFRNPISIFDGVPEVSIAVPPNTDFPYFFPPRLAGTYMYHCHFEDVEHVQLGMDGIVYVRPNQNKTGVGAGAPIARLGGNAGSLVLGYAYNDGVATTSPRSTAYDREFTLLLNEVDPIPHDNLGLVQEFLWSDYKPVYWLINGRAYPHTLIRNDDPTPIVGEVALLVNEDPTSQAGHDGSETLRQPVSSLIQVNAADRVLLRFVNLGYEQQSMQLHGIPTRVVGEDATFLRGPNPVPTSGADLSYRTNTIYIGPGESRDVLFTAPAFAGPGTPDPLPAMLGASYNSYLLKNRNVQTLHNNGATVNGLGGQVTEVWVYDGDLPPIDPAVDPLGGPNRTYVSL
jgi:FtsP/CotA-like multicopper oxidase with cupredoxin domain